MRKIVSVKNGMKLQVANTGQRLTGQKSYKRKDDIMIAALEWKNEAFVFFKLNK